MTRAALQGRAPEPDTTTTQRRRPTSSQRTDSAEDRFGAARAGLPARDSWTEIAEILAGLLDDGPTGSAASAPPPSADPLTATAEDDPASIDSPGALPVAPAPAPPPAPSLPNTATTQVLTGVAPPPQQEHVDVPPGPPPTQAEIPPPDGAPPSAPSAAPPAAPAPAPDADAAGDSGGGPGAVVRRWQGRVASAGTRLPQPQIAVPPDAQGAVLAGVQSAETRNQAARDQLPGEALSNVPVQPVVEDPPAPPASNPVPEQTSRILALSNLRLPDQQAPPLEPSPTRPIENEVSVGGTLPRAGEAPVGSDMFQVLTSPAAAALAQTDPNAVGPDGQRTPEATRIQAALAQLRGDPRPAGREGRGPQIIAPDTGPQPVPPLAEAMRVPVGEVVARLLADTDTAANQVLDGLRTAAFTGGALKRAFPEIGADMRTEIKSSITVELNEIATAANVSATQLQGMIADRQRVLAESGAAATRQATDTAAAATRTVQTEGQRTMDAVAGAADQAEEETLRRQEAAGGSSDPAVVNRRRDRTLDWIREHVTTQTSHYQEAGDRRAGDLNAAQEEQANAYRALVEREQYEVLTPAAPRPARSPADRVREAHLADINIAIRTWSDERIRAIGTVFRQLIGTARTTTQTHRTDIEGAGDRAIVATRSWADDKILEGQGWWSRFIGRIRNWLHGADQANQQWRVRRTREMRDSVAADLQLIARANAQLATEMTQDEVLADQTLTAAQRETLRQFFALPAGTHPLEFASIRLRGKLVEARLASARASFEQSVIATPVGDSDLTGADRVNDVARADGGGGFDGRQLAERLHAAMDQMGTDEASIFSALRGLTPLRASAVRKSYYALYGSSLDSDLDWELSGDEYRRAMAQLEGQQAAGDAIALHDAIAGPGTDEAAIFAVLASKSAVEAAAIRAEYLRRYGETLDEAIRGDMDPGNDRDRAFALLSGDTDTANAIAVDEAMRGGFLGLGTSEEEIERVYTDMRAEVLARARNEGWSSAEMEAEIRRRNAALEQRFGERYANVAQYRDQEGGGSVLARAYRSELSGPELDLANALQANDATAADAARIRVEDQSAFYASDDKINAVLQSQYDRALEARRLDEGPARSMRVARAVEEWSNATPQLSEEEISRRRMALEREMEHGMADAAQADSRASMARLNQFYGNQYDRSLYVTVWRATSGTDHTAAMQRLEQGGRLTPLQQVEHATVGLGTDEAALRQLVSTMTLDEIRTLRRQWENMHPGESFDSMLRDELGGRDESDVMDRIEHGAPESARARIAEERRRSERELGELTGVLGGVAAGREARRIEYERTRLEALDGDLQRTTWPDTDEARAERARLRDEVDFRVQRVQDAVEDHRRKIDSVTDTATQVVGIVVGVVVGAIVTALSAGTMGPAAIAALSALISSLASTAATMATKQLIQGGSYSGEDMALDVTVGIVDAIASRGLAKYGLGGRMALRLEALIARSRVGAVAARMVERAAESSLAQRALRLPGMATVARAASRVVPTRAGFERAAAHFLGEGINDAVGALPSTLTQITLTDTTWEGDPLHAFLEGGGMAMLQAALMGRMLEGGMTIASHAFVGARTRLRMHSETGRLAEANRVILDSYSRFHQDNPGASLADFLQHPEGRRMRAEIEARGLLPTLETAAAHPVTSVPLDAQGNPRPRTAAEIRADALESAIPRRLREGASITADPDLTGRAVHVEPLRIGNQIVGVDIRVGPHATPLDIALHAGTIQAMQRYRGTLGNIRRAFADALATATRSGLQVGSRGWEAQLEIAKLSAIVTSRIDELAGRALTPEMQAHAQADIRSLERQLLLNQAILADASLRGMPGRGYVAAEDQGTGRALSDQQKAALGRPDVITHLGELRAAIDRGFEHGAFHDDPNIKKTRQAVREARALAKKVAQATGLTIDQVFEHVAPRSEGPTVAVGTTRHNEQRLAAAERERIRTELLAELTTAFKLPPGELEQVVLREMLDWLLKGEQLKGRRPDTKDLLDALRGTGKTLQGLDVEGFIPLHVLEQNVAAVAKLRERIDAFKPDIVFGVQEGGAFIIEALAPPEMHGMPGNFHTAEKGEGGKRTPFLKAQILAAIRGDGTNPGVRRFMIADSLMGGHAVGEFENMFVEILKETRKDYPGVVLETLWLRERRGYERTTLSDQQAGRSATLPEIPVARDVAEAGGFVRRIEPVYFVIGDDLEMIRRTDPTKTRAQREAHEAKKTRPIVVFNEQGRVVQSIAPPVPHPATGEMLTTSRQILAALMQGHRFDDIRIRETARTVSAESQARHLQGTPEWDAARGSYFRDPAAAQAVLDAVHSGAAQVIGRNANGDLVVRFDGVTGYSNNVVKGEIDQPTNIFVIEGTGTPTVIPTTTRQER